MSLRVELVAADRLVWSGDAQRVIARTAEGDIGILGGHAPLLGLLVEGVVEVETTDTETWTAAVDAGFLSVANDRVSILAEQVDLAHDIDLSEARKDLERAQQSGEGDDEQRAEVRRLEARVRAAERTS